jgi:RNA polymerase sigma-70 factor (ECF subfamily)
MTSGSDAAAGLLDLGEAVRDDAAFEIWYRRTVPRVYSYLASRCLGDDDLAQELTQQTYVAAVTGRAPFDGRSDQVTWLCGIARHKLADHFRRLEREERGRMAITVRELAVDAAAGRRPAFEDRVLIADALRGLPTAQRAVLTFVALDGLPVAEAARLMGRSFAATQSLLARARESFRRTYEPEA